MPYIFSNSSLIIILCAILLNAEGYLKDKKRLNLVRLIGFPMLVGIILLGIFDIQLFDIHL